MPLKQGSSKEIIQAHIKELIASGKTPEQAAAIAYNEAGVAQDAMDSARAYDLNGFFEIKDNPISKVGVFDYMGSSIGAPEPNKVYKVYRPAEELASPECLDSFKLLPLVDDHTMLGAQNSGLTPAESKGVHGVIGEDVKFTDGYIKANLKVFSEKLKRFIADGKKELSCGYRCIYEFMEGVYDGQHYDAVQRQIRGNHLALVDQGRMGKEVAILDHLKLTIDSKEIKKMELKEIMDKLDALVKQVTSMDEAIAELKKDEEKVADKKAAKDEEADPAAVKKDEKEEEKAVDKKAMDAMDSTIKGLKTEIESLKKDGVKSMLGEISRRDALAKSLSNHIGSFDASEKTLTEVAKYGVEKLGLKCADGQEEAAIAGFLHGRVSPASAAVAQDSKSKNDAIAKYINGNQ